MLDRTRSVGYRSATSTLPRLNSLWVGQHLGLVERVCLLSAQALGHHFVLWSYDPDRLAGVPDGVELRDAAEVMPRERLLRYRDSGSVTLGANLWRVEAIARGLGYWVDLDFIFLRPLDFTEPYVFGWEYDGWINNALLAAPPDSPFIGDMLALPRANTRPPWFGPKRSAHYYWRRLREGHLGIEDMPWGTYSAGLVTHCVKKHRIRHYALPPEVFYPLRWNEAHLLYGSPGTVEARLTSRTRAIHMWRSQLKPFVGTVPPVNSYLAATCHRLGLEPTALS